MTYFPQTQLPSTLTDGLNSEELEALDTVVARLASEGIKKEKVIEPLEDLKYKTNGHYGAAIGFVKKAVEMAELMLPGKERKKSFRECVGLVSCLSAIYTNTNPEEARNYTQRLLKASETAVPETNEIGEEVDRSLLEVDQDQFLKEIKSIIAERDDSDNGKPRYTSGGREAKVHGNLASATRRNSKKTARKY